MDYQHFELCTRLCIDRINRLTYRERLSGLRIKNISLHMLISRKSTASNFKVSIVNLTSRILSEEERMQLELGLEQSFKNKDKN